MNKRFILILTGMLLVGVIWGWFTALAYLIGIVLVTFIMLGRYALLKFYLKTYSLRTRLYTNPISAMLYSVIDPHRSNNSSDLDDLFPSHQTQRPEESEELPPLRFTEATEVQRGNNIEEYKN